MTSEAPSSFLHVVNETKASAFTVSDFYQYIALNYEHSVLETADSDAWNKIRATKHFSKSVINAENSDIETLSESIIETIGLLALYGEDVGLTPTLPIISCLITMDVDSGIQRLVKHRIITLRAINDSYALWHGSTIDVASRIQDKLDQEYHDFHLA